MSRFKTMTTSIRLEGDDQSVRAYLETLKEHFEECTAFWSDAANRATTKRGAARDMGEAEGNRRAASMIEAVMHGLPSRTEEDRLKDVITQAAIAIGSMLPERLDPVNSRLHAEAYELLYHDAR